MKKNKGFTLVELMVVIVIIGILAALAIPKLLGATAKAKLTEFKPVLKSIYTLQETHFAEAGSYSATEADIGYKKPGGKASFDYAISATATKLGTATTKSGVSIKLSDESKLDASKLTACTDSTGGQYAHTGLSQVAKDAGLIDSDGTTALVKSCS